MINRDDEEIKSMLKHYVPSKWHNLNNWDILISREKELSDDLNLISCSFMDLFFDNNGFPVNYGDVHIVGDDVYYDFNSDDLGSGTYTLLGEIYKYD